MHNAANQSIMDLQQLIQMSENIIINWIQLLMMVRQFFIMRRLNRRRLLKPHLLLHLLAGYR